jgi:hypothetical protein
MPKSTLTQQRFPVLATPDAPGWSLGGPAATAVLVAAGAAVLYGALLRAWLLAHLPLWGDEAIVGLQARAIGSGHFSAFYWGQHYGGLEPYVVAAALRVGGGGETALNITPVLLSAVSAVLVAGITLAAGRDRLVALAAGVVVWVWPYAVVWQSVREGGFREAALCCGLTAVLCCIRVYQRRAGTRTFLLLGLALGLGWWASAEIAYFVLPSLVLLTGWWRGTSRPSSQPAPPGDGGARHRWSALAVVAGGAAVGSLPWWYANAHTGFASVQRSAFPSNGGVTYGGKLSVFFHHTLPMELGVRTVLTGAWVGGPAVGKTLYALVVVLVSAAVIRAAWLCVGRPGRIVPLALAVGVVAYPFLYAAAPGTAYWNDGRYGIYLPALVAALLGAVLAAPTSAPPPALADGTPDHDGGEVVRAGPRRAGAGVLMVAALGTVGATCLTVGAAHLAGVPASTTLLTDWQNGDAPMQQAVDAMRAHDITAAYGDYWTAYDLDFLSGGRPRVSPSPLDVNRSTTIAAGVASSRDPAWLFFAPRRTVQAAVEFGNPQPGPGAYTEQTFEARLAQRGIPYKVVTLGILDAVVPSRRVTVP